jgi:YD repeat-containing protein
MNIWTQSGNDANGNPHNQVTGTNARGVTWTPDYDAAGNMLDDGSNQYLYDADGHVCAVRNLTYGGMTGYLCAQTETGAVGGSCLAPAGHGQPLGR